MKYCYYDAPFGRILITVQDGRITGIGIKEEACRENVLKYAEQDDTDEVLKLTCKWFDVYFAGARPNINMLPLAPSGTSFQKRVWEILSEIPYGEITTYGNIAAKIAEERGVSKFSAQAVGGALGRNPISIIIPCHRVIGADGSLKGFASGLEIKKFLLELEGVKI